MLELNSALALPSIEITSSHFKLITGKDTFMDARRTRTNLIVTMTTEDPATARTAADDLTKHLRKLPATHTILHRIDPQ